MTDLDLLIVGAGPTGLVAAIDAARRGLSVRIVDRNRSRTPYSKALVLHSRSMEVFDDLGCVDRLLAAGRPFKALNMLDGKEPLNRVDFSQLDWGGAPYPMWFTLPQSETERCLEEHLGSLGVEVERETAMTGLTRREDGVDVSLRRADGGEGVCRASWVLGSDGARSDVRAAIGVELSGDATRETFVLADVTIESELADAEGYNVLSPEGVLLIVPMPRPGRVRLIAHLPGVPLDPPPPLDLAFFQRLIERRAGISARLSDLGWTSAFSPKHLVARSHRAGRVILAGDAGHLHSPVGGQGLNTGIQDSYNLIWKLASVHRGHAPPSLLDTYGAERHAIAEAMIGNVRRATRLITAHNELLVRARNALVGQLFRMDFVKNLLGAGVGMLDLHYPEGPAIAAPAPGACGLLPGQRARLLAGAPALSDAVRGPLHSLLILDDRQGSEGEPERRALASLAARRAGQQARVLRVRSSAGDEGDIADPAGLIREAWEAKGPCAVWLRPDKYAGFSGGIDQIARLDAYLGALFNP